MAFAKTRGFIGVKRMERKLRQLGSQGGRRVANAAMSAMATPLKAAIRLGVKGSTKSMSLKKAANATVAHRMMKPKFDAAAGIKVGFGVAERTTMRGVPKGGKRVPTKKAAKATERAGSKRRGVGISAVNIHWMVLGTGKKSTMAGKVLASGKRSRATGETRRHKSGHKTGSTRPYFEGVVPAAVISATPVAMKIGAAKAKVALKKAARKLRSP